MASSSGQIRPSSPDGAPATGGLYYVPAPAALEPAEAGGFQLQTLVKVLRRRRRTFLLVAVAVTLAAGALAVSKRMFQPIYAGGFNLLIADPISETGQGTNRDDGSISSVARNLSRVDVPTLIRVLESPRVLGPVYERLRQSHPTKAMPRISVSLLPAGVGGQNVLSAGVLAVSGQGSSPELVHAALKQAEKAFLDWALEQRREKLSEGVKFLDEQAPKLKSKSDALQSELERFRLKHNVLAPADEAQAVRSQVESLRSELLKQQAERQRLQQVRAEVAGGRLAARSFSSSTGADGAGLAVDVPNQSELEELSRLEAQIAAARATYQSGSPMLQGLIRAREQLFPELQRKQLEAVDAALQQLDLAIASSKEQIDRLEGRFSTQPALLRQFQDLNRQLEIADGNLASYLRTREQFQLEIAQNNVPWKVITPTAVNPTPVEPDLGRDLLQGLLLGLLAGAGAALLHDRLDHVFHSPGEVRDELRKPLLGHIPYISFFQGVRRDRRFLLGELDSAEGGLESYQRFSYQEAFRNLYTSLRFLSSDRQVRSVVMSSSVPGEGKSLVLVLLAKTLSELGQRVLVVDADLRKPQLHHRLGLNNLQGLSNLLIDEQRPWREVVQPVADYPNWDVITAGQRPPDPPRLLSSARMGELVREIAESGGYDLVLYDTPPALGLADASLVAEHLDGILLLVSLGRVDRRLPAEALQRIQAAGAPLLGVVTNARVAREGLERPYGGYSYGAGRYGGSYGYGANDPYDPAVAYSYYSANTGDEERPSNLFSRLLPRRAIRKRWRRNLREWLNG
jgi:capsular exopolysaccharide synthesis family protein